jgi:hypothetical protein
MLITKQIFGFVISCKMKNRAGKWVILTIKKLMESDGFR